jgi:hypothetical protein
LLKRPVIRFNIVYKHIKSDRLEKKLFGDQKIGKH